MVEFVHYHCFLKKICAICRNKNQNIFVSSKLDLNHLLTIIIVLLSSKKMFFTKLKIKFVKSPHKKKFKILAFFLIEFSMIWAQDVFRYTHYQPYRSEGVCGIKCSDGCFATAANVDVFIRTDTIVLDCEDCKIPYDTIFQDIITSDILIVKTNTLGNVLWRVLLGNEGDDRCYSISETPDRGFLVCATDSSSTGRILKLNNSGELVWENRLELHYPKQIINVGENFLVLGTTSHLLNGTDSDIYIQMIDAFGVQKWKKYLGLNGKDEEISGRYNETFKAACKGPYDNIFVTGIRKNDIVWFDIDFDGIQLASGTIGDDGIDDPIEIALSEDLNYVILLNYAPIPVYNTQPRLMKINTSGEIISETAYFDNILYDKAMSLSVLSDGGFLINGLQNSNVPSVSVLYNLKVNANGIPQWIDNKPYGNEAFCIPVNAFMTSDNRIFETGTTATGRFTFTERTVNTTNNNVEFNPVTRTGMNPNLQFKYSVFPNPARDYLSLQTEFLSNGTFSLYLPDGRKVMAVKLNSTDNQVSLAGIHQGVYLYKFACNEGNFTGKIIIQK